jgi:hypothetical protein
VNRGTVAVDGGGGGAPVEEEGRGRAEELQGGQGKQDRWSIWVVDGWGRGSAWRPWAAAMEAAAVVWASRGARALLL